jgi:hypothetical protein
MFLYFLVKVIIEFYKARAFQKLTWTTGGWMAFEFVMFVLCALFAYVCFRIRKNMRAKA